MMKKGISLGGLVLILKLVGFVLILPVNILSACTEMSEMLTSFSQNVHICHQVSRHLCT